jgi:hypothetical protein
MRRQDNIPLPPNTVVRRRITGDFKPTYWLFLETLHYSRILLR